MTLEAHAVLSTVQDWDAVEIDLHNQIDPTSGVRYIGTARKQFDGTWRCAADVGGALCLVEIFVRPLLHINTDPGDEDDLDEKRWLRSMRERLRERYT